MANRRRFNKGADKKSLQGIPSKQNVTIKISDELCFIASLTLSEENECFLVETIVYTYGDELLPIEVDDKFIEKATKEEEALVIAIEDLVNIRHGLKVEDEQ